MLIPAISNKNEGERYGVIGTVFLTLTLSDSLSPPNPLLVSTLRSTPSVGCGPFRSSNIDASVSWLDSGASFVVFEADPTAKEEDETSIPAVAAAIVLLPSNRVIVKIIGETGSSFLSSSSSSSLSPALCAAFHVLKDHVRGFILPFRNSTISSDLVVIIKTHIGSGSELIFERTISDDSAIFQPVDVGRLHRQGVNVLSKAQREINASLEDIELETAKGYLDIGACVTSCIRSDRPDGLFTTVVSDECGKTLGLVYSSKESIIEAIRCGRGVYYSRSRNGLWRKGDTSGNYQELKAVRIDCDGDALLFTVKQLGLVPAFCHLNTRSCWGEDGGLGSLERTLAARLVDAPVGSYTKRLFEDETLLKNKLMEEAMELSEATEPDHVAAEAADLLYFALVRCAKAGVSIADIEKHLDRRALKVRRRPGDSKSYRIEAAKAFEEGLKKGENVSGASAI
jgi:phosphoribosyl-ATP pyrophosphohydrolase / phosphoribosyl-AMP cyclohydrolase / histidinol dehydrogenase